MLDYIDGLMSQPSLTREAILNDPEEVERLAALPEPEDDWTPRISEWRLEHALMYDTRSILASIKQIVEQQYTGKPAKRIEPLPVPRTRLDAAREKVRRARIEELKYAFGYRPPVDD